MEPERISTHTPQYVRIPFGTRIQYPPLCPFTGRQNPRHAISIRRYENQMILPIPFIGWFRLGKVGRTVFPAVWRITFGAKVIAIMSLLSLVAGFASLIWTANKPSAWVGPVAGVALFYLCSVAEWLWLRRVRIIRIGMSSLEVRFAWQQYAEEFCHLNELHCHSRPTRKRHVPIAVNDIR
jgi:hypothetical protein